MPRLIALEWNHVEARIAVAGARGPGAIERVLVLPLATPPEGAAEPADIGRQIGAALHAHGLSRAEALVGIGRSSAELRQLSLPPAPDDELPDLLRMQATREFNTVDESWPLDFVPQRAAPNQPRSVLAAVIEPTLLADIEKLCEAANLKPLRIELRPFAAAACVHRRRPAPADHARLLVDLVGDEAELTVLDADEVVFLRAARLPGDPLTSADAAQILMGELRRTLAAAQNQLGASQVQSILLCGAEKAHAELAETIRKALPLPVELFDVFDLPEVASAVRGTADSRRMAALFGMLLDELDHRRPALDFLHPRRRPELPDRRRGYILAGAALTALALLYFAYIWWASNQLANEARRLAYESRSLDPSVAIAEKTFQSVTELSKWTEAEVVWLDKLQTLARKLPHAQDVMLTQVVASTGGGHVGQVKLEGLAKSPEVIDALETALRDAGYHVEGKGRSWDQTQKSFPWRFVSTVFVSEKRP